MFSFHSRSTVCDVRSWRGVNRIGGVGQRRGVGRTSGSGNKGSVCRVRRISLRQMGRESRKGWCRRGDASSGSSFGQGDGVWLCQQLWSWGGVTRVRRNILHQGGRESHLRHNIHREGRHESRRGWCQGRNTTCWNSFDQGRGVGCVNNSGHGERRDPRAGNHCASRGARESQGLVPGRHRNLW